MSRIPEADIRPTSRFEPHRRIRVIAGPLFGIACFLATLSGVVILSLLLGSVVAGVVKHESRAYWLYPQIQSSLVQAGGAVDGAALPGVVAVLHGSPSTFIEGFAEESRFSIASLTEDARRLGHLLGSLLSGKQSSNPRIAGFKMGVVGSLWLLAMVASFSIPVGVGAAVFLEEFVPPGRVRRIIQTNIANLAGVPSIVYGILGLAVFVRAFGYKSLAMGPSLLAGSLTLGLLILPVIVIATQEALRTVPSSLRQAALALGATRWQMISGHVLPSALPAILTGTILGLSRAIGETAPLLMVGAAGSIMRLPKGPMDRYTALPVEIYNYAKEPNVEFQTVAAGGILLLVFLLLTMNATAILIRSRYTRIKV